MASEATLKYFRVPPRKARLVVNLIRGKSVNEATAILRHTTHKSSKPIEKLLKSAVSNATSSGKVDPDNLFVSKIVVNDGPIMKRYTSRAQGRGDRVNKRTSHITVVLGEK
jgi:large subunit ribosomal protein L22